MGQSESGACRAGEARERPRGWAQAGREEKRASREEHGCGGPRLLCRRAGGEGPALLPKRLGRLHVLQPAWPTESQSRGHGWQPGVGRAEAQVETPWVVTKNPPIMKCQLSRMNVTAWESDDTAPALGGGSPRGRHEQTVNSPTGGPAEPRSLPSSVQAMRRHLEDPSHLQARRPSQS